MFTLLDFRLNGKSQIRLLLPFPHYYYEKYYYRYCLGLSSGLRYRTHLVSLLKRLTGKNYRHFGKFSLIHTEQRFWQRYQMDSIRSRLYTYRKTRRISSTKDKWNCHTYKSRSWRGGWGVDVGISSSSA